MAVAVVGVSLAVIHLQYDPTFMYRCTPGTLRVLQEPPEPSGMWQ